MLSNKKLFMKTNNFSFRRDSAVHLRIRNILRIPVHKRTCICNVRIIGAKLCRLICLQQIR